MDSVYSRRVAAENKKRELDAQAKAINAEIDDLDAEIQLKFEDESITSIKCDGYTIFSKRDAYPKMLDKQALVGYFLSTGEEHMLAVNYQTLKSYLKDKFPDGRDGIEIPESHEMKKMVDAEPKYGISIRKA